MKFSETLLKLKLGFTSRLKVQIFVPESIAPSGEFPELLPLMDISISASESKNILSEHVTPIHDSPFVFTVSVYVLTAINAFLSSFWKMRVIATFYHPNC